MIGLVLVSHGRLAQELLNALEHVVGPQSGVIVVGIEPDDNGDERRDEILKAIQQVNTGSGVIIVTDMFGGTPSNLAISAMDDGDVEVLAGANLPMLIKLASVRQTMTLLKAAEEAQNAGRKYINIAGSLLNK
ncbi:MAG: PTS sugar transporter subunit IIA [Anderseniella sp.]